MTIDKKSSIVNQMWISGSNIKYLGNFDKKTMPELNFNLENNPQQQTDGGNFEQIVPFRGRRNVNTSQGEADTNVSID